MAYLAVRHNRERLVRNKRLARMVKETLVQILRRGSIIDTDYPEEIDAAMLEQEKIAGRIEKTL